MKVLYIKMHEMQLKQYLGRNVVYVSEDLKD